MRCMEKVPSTFFNGIVDYQHEGKGRGDHVKLIGLILISIMSDKIFTSLKGEKHL